MRRTIVFAVYFLIGIIGGQVIGYGLLEALLWPVFAPIALYSRMKKGGKSEKDD